MPDATSTVEPASSPVMVAHLHLVAKLALWTGLSSGLVFSAILYYLDYAPGLSYASMFHSLIMTRQQLKPALITSGSILLAMTGLVTWLIAVYSTYRVAGPLHQFTQNLILQIENGPCTVDGLTDSGDLENEQLRLAGAANRLQYHYDSFSELVDLALGQLELEQPNLGDGLKHNLKKIKELDSLVKL
ncbi:MAG: hypothetical protein HQL07_14170 [Nitrospirae bacterium]|nr:hypothetical protein [Magnetococcales bacterium]HAT50903.1 hypothetical protein [Alphaproteobacteria bacterium]